MADEVLYHYSERPMRFSNQRTYEQGVAAKPRGLWVSVSGEFDWPTFCQENDFRIGTLAARHRVVLREGANILRPNWLEELRPFEFRDEKRLRGCEINWPKVAEQYDGIIIAPYDWHSRLTVDWYYGWDCASGCIWNLDAVESVTVENAVLEETTNG